MTGNYPVVETTVPKVFLKRKSDDAVRDIQDALDWLDWKSLVPPGSTIFLKPNLTWRVHMPGVTTSPQFISAVVEAMRTRSDNIIVGESDGGYHTFDAEEAFESHGLYELGRRTGVEVVNLSDLPSEEATTEIGGKQVTVELPSLLLHDVDVFVTLPVPKVHVMTRVSLGFKNQWGCMPDPMRLRNHAQFAHKVLAINKLLRPRLALFDGAYVLDRMGPTIGQPVKLDLVVGADDVGAGSLVWCQIMGIDPGDVKHLLLARRIGMLPKSLDEVELNTPLDPFRGHRFQLERKLVHWISLAAFNSRILTRILYDSRLAVPLHNFVYAVRKNRAVGRLLYGDIGPPPVEGARSRPDEQSRRDDS